ncbi:chemotaxis protein methyltransferase CheR [Rhodobacter viridis]|uniref:Chemotaxis protein methyltransferase n=1 Tax=Rhodobacter viridis TaxID=1054202 RepID=A0A318TXL0_9RHOB|nr:CheR family methyltransferase [Rhodobacter viridis]PYF09404.1 chemotaxis protein methyltransferase CheR [Rhodobacter viridis]
MSVLVRPATRRSALFDQFTDFVRLEIGVNLSTAKRTMIEGRFHRHLLELGLKDFDAYLAWLFEEGALDQERDAIFDAITTNKTDFFREPEHFQILRAECLPRFRASGRTRCKIWSAAASIGAEAWTIAIVLAEEARAMPFDWAILGTDINASVLETARRAIYADEMLRPVPPALRARYFLRGQAEYAQSARVVPDLRRRVQFQRLNLMDPAYPVDHDVDVIFLRNVLIYFEPEDQAAVIDRLVTHLDPGGCLFVGHSESMVVRHPALQQIAPAVYRRR